MKARADEKVLVRAEAQWRKGIVPAAKPHSYPWSPLVSFSGVKACGAVLHALCAPLRFCARTSFFLLLFVAAPLAAQDSMPPPPYAYRQLANPAQEAKAQALMETLRCLQCQGQSIADSDAPIAGAMRSLVRERIAAGEAPEAIRRWLIQRYGDYVSYSPQLSAATWPLFALPAVLLAFAAVLLRRRFGRSAA